MEYKEFLAGKAKSVKPAGVMVENDAINAKLFDFQKDIVRWALKMGRAAVFADTGLGKTFIQLEWSRIIGKTVLIFAPPVGSVAVLRLLN